MGEVGWAHFQRLVSFQAATQCVSRLGLAAKIVLPNAVDTVLTVTLPLSHGQQCNIKMPLTAAHLNAEIILVVTL